MKKIFALCPSLFAFAFAFALTFLPSCLTVSRIQNNCDKFAKICVTSATTQTIYRDTTIYRHDTVFYQLPSDTVTIVANVPIINNQAQLNPITKKFGFIGVNAFIKNNLLNINAWLTDSTILIPYRDTIFINDAFTATTTQNTVTVREKYIPKFYKFTFWVVILQLAAIAFFVAGYFLRFKFKLLTRFK